MATRGASKRLAKEYQQIQQDPPEFAIAKPNERNILEWHYIITGPPETPYHDGQYYGTLNFPPDYPFKPPSIKMSTPSGRFQCNTRLCLSISDFHPKSWNPSWQVSTILTGLVSFMTSDEMTTGGISTPDHARIGYARDSRANNIANTTFVREFPEIVQDNKTLIAQGQASLGFARRPATRQGAPQAGLGAKTNSDGTGASHVPDAQHRVAGSAVKYWVAGLGVILILAVFNALTSDAS